MKSILQKPDTESASTSYPYGSIQDQGVSITGTPVSREVYGDFHQFFERIVAKVGVTPNDSPDNASNGFQLVQALAKYIGSNRKSITVNVSQSGLTAPTVTELENVSNPDGTETTWGISSETRNDVGEYSFKITGLEPSTRYSLFPSETGVSAQSRRFWNANDSSDGSGELLIIVRAGYDLGSGAGFVKADGYLDNVAVRLEAITSRYDLPLTDI